MKKIKLTQGIGHSRGTAFADPELNTPDQIAQGKVTFEFDFTPPYPAEHIIFRSRMTDDYLSEIV